MITVLMAVRNGERYLDEQLESLFSQSIPCQIIVRDDASTDATRDLLQRYAKHLTIIHSPLQLGACQTFSELLQEAKSPYICFADADDVWLPDKLEKTLDAMRRLEEGRPLLIHTDLKVVDADLTVIADSFWAYSHLTPHSQLNRQLVQNTITGNTVMINKALRDICGPIPPQAIMHDWWLGIVAASFGHIGWVDEPTVLYRQHGSNDTGAKPYSFWGNFSLKKGAEFNRRVAEQARANLQSYSHSPTNRTLIEAFLKFMKTPPLLKLAPLVYYGFFKQGVMRSLKAICR